MRMMLTRSSPVIRLMETGLDMSLRPDKCHFCDGPAAIYCYRTIEVISLYKDGTLAPNEGTWLCEKCLRERRNGYEALLRTERERDSGEADGP